VPSLKKSLGMSRNSWIWSDMVTVMRLVIKRDEKIRSVMLLRNMDVFAD
jgi:hypothetical protein